jgi:hypothetical protein
MVIIKNFINILKGEKMKKQSALVISMLLLSLILILPTFSQADIFMKQKTHTDGMQMMGQTQAPTDQIQTIWMAGDRIRSDSDEGSVILRLDQGKIYFLDNTKKTYSEMPMDMSKIMDEQMKKSMDEEGMDAEEQQAAAGMMQGMTQMKMTVTPTAEKKKIGQYNCQKYLMDLQTMMGPSTSELWATEDLKMDYELYSKFSAAMMGKGGMFGGMMKDMMEEMKKVKGVTVLTVTTMNMMGMSIKSTQELIEYKEGTAPAGYFNIPSGYKKTESDWEQE